MMPPPSSRITVVTLSVIFITFVSPMCLSPSWNEDANNRIIARNAPLVVVGSVLKRPLHNTSHQRVTITVDCIYKLDKNKTDSVVSEEEVLNTKQWFIMQYFNNRCAPLLKEHTKYIFFFEVKGKKPVRPRKKSKKGSHGLKLESKGQPVPIHEMKGLSLDRLVTEILDQGFSPAGKCYNTWSRWSACSKTCGVGEMKRSYYRLNQETLNQTAVCLNSPCEYLKSASFPSGQDFTIEYQPINIGHCKSMELVRVKMCHYHCKDKYHIYTAETWNLYLTLMLCKDAHYRERLEYTNIAIPDKCKCMHKSVPRKFAEFETLPEKPNRRRRHHQISLPENL